MAKVQVTIRAYNKEGYQKDILVMDEEQMRMSCVGIKDGLHGPIIDPSLFPETVKFEVIVKEYQR